MPSGMYVYVYYVFIYVFSSDDFAGGRVGQANQTIVSCPTLNTPEKINNRL